MFMIAAKTSVDLSYNFYNKPTDVYDCIHKHPSVYFYIRYDIQKIYIIIRYFIMN